MAKTVKVTRAQNAAAKYIVERSAKSGQLVSNSVRKIAEAQTPRAAVHYEDGQHLAG